MKRFSLPLLVAAAPAFSQPTDKTTCFPENNLHLQDRLGSKQANIDEARFNDIITQVISYYKPIATSHGATLSVERKWEDSTVNAYAEQSDNDWSVAMFGGLARRPEVTPDGFAMVVCHEVGHHLAGFPFYGAEWAASEGQSDYFATQACATNIWKGETETNSSYRAIAPQIVKDKCDSVFTETARQNVCYRTSMAGKSLGQLLAALGGESVPQFDSPDMNVVSDTVATHPAGQCRLDTYFSGALCSTQFDDLLIPGRGNIDGQGSMSAEREAALQSCTDAALFSTGKRPKCWYSAKLALTVDRTSLRKTEIVGNGNGVWEPGESYAINIPLVNNLLIDITGGTLQLTESGIVSMAEYPQVAAGETEYALGAIQISPSSSRRCGDQLSIKAKVQVDSWIDESTINFILGENLREEHVEMNTVVNIPDAAVGAEQTVIGTSDKRTTKVMVSVDITHTYSGDLRLELVGPSGTKYMIQNRVGGPTDDIKQTFTVPVNGEAIAGSWKLIVTDAAPADVGMLNSWGIDFATISCE